MTSVPSGIPRDTTELFITKTNIDTLKERSFQNLTLLRRLSLSFNKIRQILPGAFDGAHDIVELYLNNNQLQLTSEVYVPGIFRNLSSLNILHLNANSNVSRELNYSYPDANWKHLPMLQELRIDGLFQKPFPRGFSNLINLTNFSISGKYSHCNIQALYNSTFLHFRQTKLRFLDISFCNIYMVEAFTFKPLQGINTIDMQYQLLRYPYKDMSNVFVGLEHSAIRTLIMNHVCRFGSHVVTADTFKPLQNTKLQQIYLDHNYFVIFEKDWTSGLPRSLEHVTLNKNYIIQFSFTTSDIFYIFSANINYWSMSLLDFSATAINISIPLPMKLETVIITSTHADVRVPPVIINSHNNLKTFQLSDATLPEYHGCIKGLDKLEEFVLTNANCRYISTDCFKYMPSLRLLNISSNYLGDVISKDIAGEYFNNLRTLEVLDISQNMIRYLPEKLFMNLQKLQALHLRNNALSGVNASVSHMHSLRYIDLAHNSIASFGVEFTRELDVIMKYSNLTIDLRNNSLICSCNTLSFLTWLQRIQQQFVSLSSYQCHFDTNNTSVFLNNLDLLVEILDAKCSNFEVLISSASVALVLLTLIPVVGMIYRYRMHLLYWYYVVKRSTRTPQQIVEDNFKYDAFVSFADEDYQFIIDDLLPVCEKQHGLNLCIHCRDFIPGTPIAENITNAIHCSRKTIILLDEYFLASAWCMYEYRMACMEHIYSCRENIILVMYKGIEEDRLPLDILETMMTQTYLVFPPLSHMDTFWNLLRSAIRGEQL